MPPLRESRHSPRCGPYVTADAGMRGWRKRAALASAAAIRCAPGYEVKKQILTAWRRPPAHIPVIRVADPAAMGRQSRLLAHGESSEHLVPNVRVKAYES